MFLFDRNKLKVRSEENEDGIVTFVEYYEIKQKDVFKVKVLKKLIGDKYCLGVIDSKTLYYGPQKQSKITFEEIIEHLDFARIAYKKTEIKKIPEVSLFGMTVKKGTKKTDKDYIIGFVFNRDNFNMIEDYANRLNIYYLIDKTGISEEALLQKLDGNYEDIEEIGKDFYCQIFDNNFIGQLSISSETKLSDEIKETVNKCYLELK